jgi:DNA-directed RNA polymerase subunit beta
LALDVKVYSEDQEEIAIKESIEDELEELNVNIEGREDEGPIAEFDEIGEDVLEDELDIEDFELGDISTAIISRKTYRTTCSPKRRIWRRFR